jgi:isochorismate pyruvate lyase
LTTLDQIREQIDSIDRALVELLAQRQSWVQKAAAHKPDDAAVAAPARVEQVIAKVRAHAATVGAAPDLVEAVYRVMIARFIELERAERQSSA